MKNQLFKEKEPRGDLSNPNCASREVFEHIMGRWGGLLLRALLKERILRFAELRDSVRGISEKVLSQTLKNFERDGLVIRKSFGEVPPRVEYSLTEIGSALGRKIKSICELIEDETFSISQAQKRFDETDRPKPWQKSSSGSQ